MSKNSKHPKQMKMHPFFISHFSFLVNFFISIQYPTLLEDLTVGDKIFINDGIVQLSVKGKEGNDLVCVVDAAGTISSHKGKLRIHSFTNSLIH